MADDLLAWLVGLFAEAGRKRLIRLVLGDEQQRALRAAATAAVRATVGEVCPHGDERDEQLAMMVSEVFRGPVPERLPAAPGTLLEALQAGIAGRVAVLDDAGVTGPRRSSADALGLPGAVLAEKLAGHLVREIILRGSGGGPLTPLASQLNHDRTHLQGRRLEGVLARLVSQVSDIPTPAVAGRPLSEVTDPFALEVHRPIQPEGVQLGLPPLPAYVAREHDVELGRVVAAAAGGSSGIAVLVGGSSTGKTRACWEALRLLRGQPEQWRLWHPIDPSRPGAALRELPGIGARTVVWLNEAQLYLDVIDDGLGERVAAGLRELLRDPARAPVLVLATLWPQFWDTLTARPAAATDPDAQAADPHAQARELLAGRDITVPAAFTQLQARQLSRAEDARLALAAAGAQDGQVIQFLAGAPELLARYRNAPPAAQALIHAAMDARRMRISMSHAFLSAAAPGYLTDTEWDALSEDWLEQALAYTAVPCKGVSGPLTRIRPRPASFRATGPGSRTRDEQLAGGPASIPGGPLYRLADYLDQYSRRHRYHQLPPIGFWAAVAAYADLDGQWDVDLVLTVLREAGAKEQVTTLAARVVAQADASNPHTVANLLDSLRKAGADQQVIALAARVVADADVRNPYTVARLLQTLREAGAKEQVTALAARAAADADLDGPWDVSILLTVLRVAGADQQVTALAARAAAYVGLGGGYEGHQNRFRFGREADGSLAGPGDWRDC